MVRCNQTRAVRVLAFEERTCVANVFMLLVEIDLQKGVPRNRRAPASTKTKARQRTNRKTKQTISKALLR